MSWTNGSFEIYKVVAYISIIVVDVDFNETKLHFSSRSIGKIPVFNMDDEILQTHTAFKRNQPIDVN